MNKTIITLTIIISATCILGLHMYLKNARYAVVSIQDKIAYQVDRKTGESWTIYRGTRKKNIGDIQEEKYKALPFEEKSKITIIKNENKQKKPLARSLVDQLYGSVSGMLYNGSSWEVKEIIVAIKAIDKDGKTKWDRQFSDQISAIPAHDS